MLSSLFSSRQTSKASQNEKSEKPSPKPATLLVLQIDDYDWVELFRDVKLRDGRGIKVVQTGWQDIQVHVDTYSSAGLCVDVQKLAPSATPMATNNPFTMTIQPDFVLVRNEVKMPNFDGRSRLNGLLFADLPAVNSLESILLFCERPAVQGQLHRLQKRLGKEAFPVVPSHFCSSSRALMYGYTFPAVVKVGSAHAGAGKMKIMDHHKMSDFRSVLAMMPDEHCSVEPFIRGASDLRIQKIGDHYRAFRRIGISGDWKTNTGSSLMEEEEMTDRWRLWADAAAEMFGGLDILTVDAIVEEGTGKETILEVNGTSSGLHPDRAAEDNEHIRDLVIAKMNAALCAD
jgi:glutathione synthase/RimK-type ligase-like ATP-grasp enzyme